MGGDASKPDPGCKSKSKEVQTPPDWRRYHQTDPGYVTSDQYCGEPEGWFAIGNIHSFFAGGGGWGGLVSPNSRSNGW